MGHGISIRIKPGSIWTTDDGSKDSDAWDYNINIKLKEFVPFTDDINGNTKKGKDGLEIENTNPRPWWHSWWYGN